MITAIGNNFGAGQIQFRAYCADNILVLNGKVPVSVSDPAFAAADVLEIYLPEQPLRKSCDSAVYVTFALASGMNIATLASCRFKNHNTLCIEKVDLSQRYGDFTLVFATAFVPKGETGPFSFEGVTELTPSSSDATISFRKHHCIVKENWVCLAIHFGSLKAEAPGMSFSFRLEGLPADIDADIPIINPDNYGIDGNHYMMAHANGPDFSIVNPHVSASSPYDGKFTKAFFVRGDSLSISNDDGPVGNE